MPREFHLAWGKVKGVLWYQGESDALGREDAWKLYPQVFSRFIASVRSDFGQAEPPFDFVQIGRFISWRRSQGMERRPGSEAFDPRTRPLTRP